MSLRLPPAVGIVMAWEKSCRPALAAPNATVWSNAALAPPLTLTSTRDEGMSTVLVTAVCARAAEALVK